MSSKFHPSLPYEIIQCVYDVIHSQKTYLKKDSSLIMVCGAESKGLPYTARDTFLNFAQRNLRQYRFFKAESVFNVLSNYEKKDLLSLEKIFCEFSDCILMIIESPGAIAELGAFAMLNDTVKLLLVVNNEQYTKSKSFLNDGPIAKINKHSKFGEVINADLNEITICSPKIKKKLNEAIKHQRNKPKDLSNYKKYYDSPKREQMLFIGDLVSLFSPLSFEDLDNIFKNVYHRKDPNLGLHLSMLQALNLVEKTEEPGSQTILYSRKLDEREYFYDYKTDLAEWRSKVVNHYFKYFQGRSEILKSRSLL